MFLRIDQLRPDDREILWSQLAPSDFPFCKAFYRMAMLDRNRPMTTRNLRKIGGGYV